jgi:hypothetical protein
MIVSVRIPRDITVSYKAMAEWKQEVGIPLNNELDPKYIGKAIEWAFFATEEDAIMFKLRFGV